MKIIRMKQIPLFVHNSTRMPPVHSVLSQSHRHMLVSHNCHLLSKCGKDNTFIKLCNDLNSLRFTFEYKVTFQRHVNVVR